MSRTEFSLGRITRRLVPFVKLNKIFQMVRIVTGPYGHQTSQRSQRPPCSGGRRLTGFIPSVDSCLVCIHCSVKWFSSDLLDSTLTNFCSDFLQYPNKRIPLGPQKKMITVSKAVWSTLHCVISLVKALLRSKRTANPL